jgi:gamma-glutamyltranspeptidase/glutathione hydrolase
MMGILDNTGYGSEGPDSAKAVHYEAEAMRRFYADRSEYLGDPDFYNVPVKQLLAPEYIASRRRTIDPDRATPSDLIGPGLKRTEYAGLGRSDHESDQTTHFNVVDANGDAVAMTYTLNNSYGNGITVPGLGFLLNDEMDDFSAKPGTPNMFGLLGSDANAIEAGKRPLSAMTPTIITRDGKLRMVVGAPGGSRITTAVLQVILDVLDFHMNAQDAVDTPRFHHQWRPDVLYLEPTFPAPVENQLKRMGYQIQMAPEIARVEAITVQDGQLQGGTRAQVHGKAAGY